MIAHTTPLLSRPEQYKTREKEERTLFLTTPESFRLVACGWPLSLSVRLNDTCSPISGRVTPSTSRLKKMSRSNVPIIFLCRTLLTPPVFCIFKTSLVYLAHGSAIDSHGWLPSAIIIQHALHCYHS